MKYLVILGDGMADRPIVSLGNRTPLMHATKPQIDKIARLGRNGKLKTIPDDMQAGSAVANLSILGYDPHKYFEGRGVLEAANMGIELDAHDLALRVNLICVEDERIKNHSAGHISTEESFELIAALNDIIASDDVRFYPGLSYKHLMVIKKGSKKIECFPPHDYPDVPFREVLPKPRGKEAESTVELIHDLIFKSHRVLEDHPTNIRRKKEGKDPANSIWPWSPGTKPSMPSFKELFGLEGAVISAVDLINGIGVYAGMEIIRVEGATGFHDTNYEGKAKAAVEALKTHDFVYLHVEASDEASHDGNIDLKIRTIEYLDQRITKHILENKDKIGVPLTIAVLTDHATPAELRIHTREPVPFAIYKPEQEPDKVESYDEVSADNGAYGTIEGTEFVKTLIS